RTENRAWRLPPRLLEPAIPAAVERACGRERADPCGRADCAEDARDVPAGQPTLAMLRVRRKIHNDATLTAGLRTDGVADTGCATHRRRLHQASVPTGPLNGATRSHVIHPP